MDSRPRGELVVAERLLGRQQHRAGAVGNLTGHRSRQSTSLDQRLQAGHLLQRRLTRPLVDAKHAVLGFHGDDLVVKVAAADCSKGAFMAGQCVLLHLLTRQVPLLGDQLRTPELRDLLIAVSVQPLLGFIGRRGEAELLADDHRRRYRDLAHVLHAAGHDHVGGARHDRLRAKGNGLLAGATLPVDGNAGNLLRVTGGQPREPGDVAGLRSDGVDTAGDHVFDGRGVDVDPVEQPAPAERAQVDRMHAGQRSVSLADRGAHSVDDICLIAQRHFRLLLW